MTIPMAEDGNGKKKTSPSPSPSPVEEEEERRIVKGLMAEAELSLKEGNLYYVVSSRWFSQWEKYVGVGIVDPLRPTDSEDSDVDPLGVAGRPGPVDNSDIVEDGCNSYGGGDGDDLDISRTLLEGRDYVLVPQSVWEKLVQWYTGGPALPRKMISQGASSKKQLNIEVYPLRLNILDSRDNSEFTIRLSKKASLHELYNRVCSLRGIDLEKASLWDYFNKHKHLRLTNSNKTLEDSNLQMDQEILLEPKSDESHFGQAGKDSTGNELALVAMEPSRSSTTIAGGPVISNGDSSSYNLNLRPGSAFNSTIVDTDNGFFSQTSSKRTEKGGLAGLQNMGNTCFMNSALQCLVHTPPLVEYFLQDYSDEINTDNPLGMHGELALAFGELLRKLWSSGRTAIAPRAFKGKLSQFAPQFSGYNQHDSQELLAFLLDGLHEDLNRVKRKPYMEMKDWSGHPDDEVAEECWRYHKARNDSIIVDVCQGQYKSTLVCPVCGKISITFDPFMYLSLPLPSTVNRSMTVTVFYGDGSGLPMPYTVLVTKHGNSGDLRQALAAACCLRSDENLLLAEVYDQKIYRLLENSLEPLTNIKDEDYVVAYRLPEKAAGKIKLEIVHREKLASESGRASGGKFFGTPLITYLESKEPSGADIDDAVSRLLSPLRRTSASVIAPSAEENGFPSDWEANGEPSSCASVIAPSGKENGFPSDSEANGEPSGSNNDHCNPTDVAMEDIELEDTSSTYLLFQLSLTDDRYSGSKPISKDSVIKSGNCIKVVLNWTEKEQTLYDPSFLKDLPVVYHKTGMSAKKTRQEAVSLFSCLEAFLKEEPLGPNDMWFCPGCKDHRQASKKLDLWKLPDILVFHLKRFSFSRFFKNKLDTFVDFPIHDLDLSKYVKENDQSYKYELFAISNHYGGLGGGHYTAFAKLIDENKWYNFDDSRVSPASEAEIRTSAAYVLFYRRVKAE